MSRGSRWLVALLGVATVALIVLVPMAIKATGRNNPTADQIAAAQASADAARASATAAKPIPTRVQPADVWPRMDDRSRTFNIAVFSDSTGAGRSAWVGQFGALLGQRMDRVTTAHQWDMTVTPQKYHPNDWHLTTAGEGEITIWNGAASGKDAPYCQEHMGEMVPVPEDQVDMVLINHGHNHASGELPREGRALFEAAQAAYPNAAIVDIMQNPERSTSPHLAVEAHDVPMLAAWARNQGYATVDVMAAFAATGNVDGLVDDTQIHPTVEGYSLWADTVYAALLGEPSPGATA